VRAIELEQGGRSFSFVNTGDNEWSPQGQAIRAPSDFQLSLDGLLNLGAQRWLAAAPEHDPLLSVRIRATDGAETSFAFGRARDGSILWLGPDGETAVVDGAAVETLLRLFR
jgi:hypothetical protein